MGYTYPQWVSVPVQAVPWYIPGTGTGVYVQFSSTAVLYVRYDFGFSQITKGTTHTSTLHFMQIKRMKSPSFNESKKNGWRVAIFGVTCMAVGCAVLFKGKAEVHQGIRAAANVIPKGEDWRGAPIGEGEDSPDSYHSYDHRPKGTDYWRMRWDSNPRNLSVRWFSRPVP